MNLKLLNLARSGNGVKRYHTITNLITPETVGHHTAGVIGIIFCLYGQRPPLGLVEAALYHDSAEYVIGDSPATAKWDFPQLKDSLDAAEAEAIGATGWIPNVTEIEWDVLKFADLMDLVFKAHSEVSCGNLEMSRVLDNGIQAASTICNEKLRNFPSARNLLSAFMRESNYAGE